MRIIHLLDSFKHGGGENVALNYAKVCNNLGYSSIFVGRPLMPKFEALLNEIGTTAPVVNKSLLDSADCIFIHTNRQLAGLLPYASFLKKQGKRVAYIQHLRYSDTKFRLLSTLINYICTDFIMITPVTSTLVERHISIRKSFIVNFYLNRYALSEYLGIKNQVRKELGLVTGQKLITFSGVFKPGKGLLDMLNLAKSFVEDRATKFLIIGDGPERDLVKYSGADNIILTGFVNDVERYLIASDYYFFPSRFKKEMLPMALVEAINTSCNICAYDTEINRFLLDSNVFTDVDEVAKAITEGKTIKGFRRYDGDYAASALNIFFAK